MTGDLLAHCIDTAMWLNGGIAEVSAMTETFIKSRKHNLTGKVEPVGIDDASLFLARFDNGSLATFEATRYARGHKALYTLEINGENASIIWDLHDLHRLQYFDHRDEGRLRGWRSIHITDGDHPYMKHWWVPGLADRLRAHVHPSGRRFPVGGGRRQERRADIPRCAADRLCDRCRSGIGRQPKLGQGWRATGGEMKNRQFTPLGSARQLRLADRRRRTVRTAGALPAVNAGRGAGRVAVAGP